MPDLSATDLNSFDAQTAETLAASKQTCLTCGLCSSACPVSGIDGFDPRKIVRMLSFGRIEEAAESRWPWICTMCARCTQVCPMEIDIAMLIRDMRAQREREKVPGILHKGVTNVLKTGNNLGVPDEDYLFVVEDVADEIAEEPGFEGFSIPVDKVGANIMTTLHNRLVNTHNDDLKHWWKIFYAAGEDWTIPSTNWEGTNWGYFTGDDPSMKTISGRIVDHMDRLEAKNLLWCE